MSGATSASFTYDGDGHRVKSVLNGVTTYYIGTHFEWTTFGAVCQTPAGVAGSAGHAADLHSRQGSIDNSPGLQYDG